MNKFNYRRPFYLQLFADEALGANAEAENAQTNEEQKELDKPSEKKYSDEDLNAILDKRFARWKADQEKEKAEAYAIKHMPDEHALNCIGAFPEYEIGHNYKVDDRFQYRGDLFKVIQAHTSQADWLPDVTKSLYVNIADPSIAFPEFIQPSGAHDAYKKGDKVAYKGKKYESLIDNNVWAPDAYPQGWKEVQ